MVAPNEKGPSLLLADGCALYLGKPPDTTVHAHYALQLTLGLARSVRLELNGQVNEWGAAAIPSLEPHRLWCMGGDLLLLYLDPTSPYGRRISAQLKVGDLRGQSVAEVADLAAIVERAFARIPATGSVDELVGLLVDRLAPPKLAVNALAA